LLGFQSLPLSSCVIVGELLNLSVPLFPICQMGIMTMIPERQPSEWVASDT